MTDPVDPSPQPVTDAAKKIGQAVTAAFVAVGLVWFLIAGGVNQANLTVVGAAVGAAITALIGLAVSVWAVAHGRAAAAQVTPLEKPLTADKQPLLTAEQWAASWGRHSELAITGRLQTALTGRRIELTSDGFELVRTGMHGHPTKKLGKLPPIPGRAAVAFGEFLTAAPQHPLVDAPPQLVYPMYHNDGAGDCVVAGAGHALQTICVLLGLPWTDWTDDQVLHFYQTQNPNFRSWADGGKSVDGGMVIQTFLEYLVAQGLILAFGKVDHTNEDEMKAAAYLGLAVVTGEVLDVAQQSQTVWDYKRSAEWGGHCTCTVGYQNSPDQQTVVTWGEEVQVTQSFITHQLDEAWFVLTQAHVDHPGFRDSFDLAGFAAAVSELTDGKVVVPVPAPQPPEPPAPAPGPAPEPAPPAHLITDVNGLMERILARKNSAHEDLAVATEWQNWETTS